jgi:hypothetical protein
MCHAHLFYLPNKDIYKWDVKYWMRCDFINIWVHPSTPAIKKFKTQPPVGKLMLMVFWPPKELSFNITRNVEPQYQVQGNPPCYEMNYLQKMMRKIIGRCSRLAQQCSTSYTISRTREALWELKFEVLDHPAYSLNLGPSDFHLSGSLRGSPRSLICTTQPQQLIF